MGLCRHKNLKRPGAPEAVLLLLIAGTVCLAALYWRGSSMEGWLSTTGELTSAEVRMVHVNSQDHPIKVDVAYKYLVGGNTFHATWQGLWPQAVSPNAMPQDQLYEKVRPGLPVVVFYDPLAPQESDLHGPRFSRNTLYAVAAIALGVVTGLFSMKIYPQWKSGRR